MGAKKKPQETRVARRPRRRRRRPARRARAPRCSRSSDPPPRGESRQDRGRRQRGAGRSSTSSPRRGSSDEHASSSSSITTASCQKGSLGVLAKAAPLGDDVAGVDRRLRRARPRRRRPASSAPTTVYVADDARARGAAAAAARRRAREARRATRASTPSSSPQSVLAADVAAGLAARLDAGLNWDLVDLVQRGRRLVGKRPALQDSVVVDVGWTSEPAARALPLRLVRPARDRRQRRGRGRAGRARGLLDAGARWSSRRTRSSEGPSIEDADVIVAGGRGLGGPENFALVEELAKALGGAVAATRAVVDAGWYPYATQVGQTGKTVSPKLYVACGISGAIQHKVGMQGSNVIVAINKDPNAPIFEFSRPRRRRRPARDRPEADRARRARGKGARERQPADFPPPFDARGGDRRRRPTRRRADRGRLPDRRRRARPGSPARSASGQLLEEQPEPAERLGDVPVAVLEKGKAPGSHLLSGAVVNPRGLQRLFKDRKRIDELPFYGRSRHESVLLPDAEARAAASRRRRRWTTTATTSRRSRSSAAGSPSEAEEGGATILPETSAEKLLVDRRPRARRAHRRPRPRPGRRGAGELRAGLGHRSRASPSSPRARRATSPAPRSTASGSQGENPQVWALGVKEVWKVAKPLDRVIHTMGWPLRAAAEVPRVRRLVHLPDGRRHGHDRHGRRARLPRRRAVRARPAAGAEDASARSGRSSTGGERSSGARRRFPEGGFLSLPKRLHAPGLLICGDGVGLVNVPALKGIHYAIESGRLAAEAAWRRSQRGRGRRPPRGARVATTTSLRESFVWSDLQQVRNMRQAFGAGSASAARWPAR